MHLLPGQDSLQTEEDDDAKLEDVLDAVYLVPLVCMFGHQFGRAVGQQLVLLYHNITTRLDRAKITEFDQREIRAKDENVLQLDIQVAEILRVDPLQR